LRASGTKVHILTHNALVHRVLPSVARLQKPQEAHRRDRSTNTDGTKVHILTHNALVLPSVARLQKPQEAHRRDKSTNTDGGPQAAQFACFLVQKYKY
jgi:hypothetical protein